MANYIEITAVGQDQRVFLDVDTDTRVVCTCPFHIPEHHLLGMESRPVAVSRDCPVHGDN